MINRLVVAPGAEAGLRDAFMWYEQRAIGLGQEFLSQFATSLNALLQSPELFRLRFGPYRLAALKRFPYAIYFIWNEQTHPVAVRRVMHFKQDAGTQVTGQ